MQQLKLLQGLGNLLRAQTVYMKTAAHMTRIFGTDSLYEYCSSHDRDLCEGTMLHIALI